MKNLFKIILCFTILISLASCGGDEVSSDGIEGTWELFEITSNSEVSVTVFGETFTSTTDLSGENIDFEITFDESMFTGQGSYDMVGTVITTGVSGSTPFNQSLENITSTGSYTATDDQLIVSGNLISLDTNGMTSAGGAEEQISTYEINSNNELIILQGADFTENANGAVTRTQVSSRAVLVRK